MFRYVTNLNNRNLLGAAFQCHAGIILNVGRYQTPNHSRIFTAVVHIADTLINITQLNSIALTSRFVVLPPLHSNEGATTIEKLLAADTEEVLRLNMMDTYTYVWITGV